MSTIKAQRTSDNASSPASDEQAFVHDDNPTSSHEASLRHIIRLQRLALSRQNLRIQQQRSLITRLHQTLRQFNEQSAEQPEAQHDHNSWLKTLLRLRNS